MGPIVDLEMELGRQRAAIGEPLGWQESEKLAVPFKAWRIVLVSEASCHYFL